MQLFSFRGRLSRLGYAWSFLISYALMMGSALFGIVGAHSLDPSFPMTHVPAALVGVQLPQAVAIAAAAIGVVAVIAFLVFTLAIDVRRFHDCNISGWFVLLWFVILLFLPDRDVSNLLPSLSSLIWVAVMITVPGTQGPNRYGAPPGPVEALAS